MQECAKICVKKCKRAKNWKINFADVCIFFFLKAVIFADFCIFYVPPPSLGVILVTLKQGIYTDYQPLIFKDSNFCVGK